MNPLFEMNCPGCKRIIDRSATRCPFCTCEIETVTVGKGSSGARVQAVFIGVFGGLIVGFGSGVFLFHSIPWGIQAIFFMCLFTFLFLKRVNDVGLTIQRVKGSTTNASTNSMEGLASGLTNLASSNSSNVFSGVKSLDNDAYKIYLSKTYKIEKNEVFGKFICQEKMFDSLDEVLAYAAGFDGGARPSSPAPISAKATLPTGISSEDASEMERYGIKFEGDKFVIKSYDQNHTLQSYRYDSLSDAIAYAKKEEAK